MAIYFVLFLFLLQSFAEEKSLELDPPPGEYTSPLYIKVKSALEGRLYFVVNDSIQPSEANTYKGLIKLDSVGSYQIQFLLVNSLGKDLHYGPYAYTVKNAEVNVKLPEPMPKGGTYDSVVQIKFPQTAGVEIEYGIGDSTKLKRYQGESIPLETSTTVYYRGVYANKKLSGMYHEKYVISLGQPAVSILTSKRVFNTEPQIPIQLTHAVRAYYSLDPFAPYSSFTATSDTLVLPEGRHTLRLFALNDAGKQSPEMRYTILVDKTPPATRYVVDIEKSEIRLFSSENGAIFYTVDGTAPSFTSLRYVNPLPLVNTGVTLVRFFAVDTLGNTSSVKAFTASSDTVGPKVTLSPPQGTFSQIPTIKYECNESCIFRFSIDGSSPLESSRKQVGQTGQISIQKEGKVVLRYLARDLAGNPSSEGRAEYIIDTQAPKAKYRILKIPNETNYQLLLEPNEPATVYVNTSGPANITSEKFNPEMKFKAGSQVSILLADSLGNLGKPFYIEEIQQPKIVFSPAGGIYRTPVEVSLSSSTSGKIVYQIETQQDRIEKLEYKNYEKPISLGYSGYFTIRVKIESPSGQSVVEEQAYIIDQNSPRVVPNMVQDNDSTEVRVVFEVDEPVRLVVTTDGSSPSEKGQVVGVPHKNKKLILAIPRKDRILLKYQATDIAGNSSPIYELDLLSPHVRFDSPPGIYHEILTLELKSQPGNRIFYSSDSALLSKKSTPYRDPIILNKTDTLWAMAVDPTGFAGPKQWAIYTIDLPPEVNFNYQPSTAYQNQPITFDASLTVDEESQLSQMQFRWDFDGNGEFDTEFTSNPKATWNFSKSRTYLVVLEAKDGSGLSFRQQVPVPIRKNCPSDMYNVISEKGSFCIDRYEWPNQPGQKPLAQKNWAQAMMLCREKGRRLCENTEWTQACKADWSLAYSYGNQYIEGQCQVEGEGPLPSGSKKKCLNKYGLFDMVGNLWEWVEGYEENQYILRGGGYNQREGASCQSSFPATLGTSSNEIGFRCCL